MERFIGAIRKSLETKNWYSALFVTLTMPDVCANISDKTNDGNRARYERWFNQYLADKYKMHVGVFREEHVFLSASDCYALRCSLIHSASDDISEQRVKQVLRRFSFSTLSSHCNQINDVLCLNVTKFCEDVIGGMEQWMKDIVDDDDAMTRLQNLIIIHEEPYSPYIGVRIKG